MLASTKELERLIKQLREFKVNLSLTKDLSESDFTDEDLLKLIELPSDSQLVQMLGSKVTRNVSRTLSSMDLTDNLVELLRDRVYTKVQIDSLIREVSSLVSWFSEVSKSDGVPFNDRRLPFGLMIKVRYGSTYVYMGEWVQLFTENKLHNPLSQIRSDSEGKFILDHLGRIVLDH